MRGAVRIEREPAKPIGHRARLDAHGARGSATYSVHPIAALVTAGDGRTAYTELHFHAVLYFVCASFW